MVRILREDDRAIGCDGWTQETERKAITVTPLPQGDLGLLDHEIKKAPPAVDLLDGNAAVEMFRQIEKGRHELAANLPGHHEYLRSLHGEHRPIAE